MYPQRHFGQPDAGRFTPLLRAVALIDARYLRWLARLDDADDNSAAELSRVGIGDMVLQALHRNELRVSLLRSYWYTDVDDQAVNDDQTVRLLAPAQADGAAVVRHMAADLQALVASGRVDVVLIASDDDRLSAPIEAAKQAGVTVCLLADERALAMPRLMQQDPNWARLLREADRRVVVRASDLAQALGQASGGNGVAAARPFAPRDAELESVVAGWWDQVPAETRESLIEELPALRGLPPDVDRELLLRCKNVLNRGLNFSEKRVLREYARRVALGGGVEAAEGSASEPRALVS